VTADASTQSEEDNAKGKRQRRFKVFTRFSNEIGYVVLLYMSIKRREHPMGYGVVKGDE
jgi:hypothetical protein